MEPHQPGPLAGPEEIRNRGPGKLPPHRNRAPPFLPVSAGTGACPEQAWERLVGIEKGHSVGRNKRGESAEEEEEHGLGARRSPKAPWRRPPTRNPRRARGRGPNRQDGEKKRRTKRASAKLVDGKLVDGTRGGRRRRRRPPPGGAGELGSVDRERSTPVSGLPGQAQEEPRTGSPLPIIFQIRFRGLWGQRDSRTRARR